MSQIRAVKTDANLPDDATANSTQTTHDSWADAYVARLALTDTIAILVSVLAAQVVRFGTGSASVEQTPSIISYTVVSCVLAASWIFALSMFATRSVRIVGTGPEEYRRLARASFAVFGTVAIVAFLLQVELARGYLAVALPLGLLTLIGSRWLWRRWLMRRRTEGRFTTRVLVIGSHRAAAAMASTFEQDSATGYRVVGVCVPGWTDTQSKVLDVHGHAVTVLGDERAVLEALQITGADMVAVSNTESLGADGMRALGWSLEAVNVDMVVSAGVVDVAGPRLHVRPVAGLPLLHVDKPQYRGASKVGKVLIDMIGAFAGVVVLSPLLILVAVAVKLTSPGPVFYRAERIGLNGKPFAMLKFRSMVVGAEAQRSTLWQHNEGAGPLFKMRDDPRVTKVGRLTRRLSIDELPQLINVLRGDMSIVGPRPPLQSEVLSYTQDVHRRLLVKPGITGLWQVSGRSDLCWEESVRLDLFYVENWSLVQDLSIIWRTLGAVIRAKGAY